MQQTLLCLLGIVVLSLYGFSRQESYTQRERGEMQREIEVAALGVFGRWESHLKTQAFDQASVDAARVRGMYDTFGLTPAAALGLDIGESHAAITSLNDFDDFDGYSESHPYPVRGANLDFDIAITVEYVQPTNPTLVSSSPTTAKRATLSVTYTPAWADSLSTPIGVVEYVTVTADGMSL